ncbi:flagellar motor switch protein FliN [Mangrovicella endophytica]|uniref:flagellar motor switch protein FliN n=1 Tax=Mangrovicella endophytica TaxID=2066697 RepID=UPI000C9E74FF|nr:flagellar motor switch protein FliN [Mangrovicella endophytica]
MSIDYSELANLGLEDDVTPPPAPEKKSGRKGSSSAAAAASASTVSAGHGDTGEKPDLSIIMDIPVTMQVVLGSAVMSVGELVKLGRGAVVKLDSKVGEPVDITVNGRIVARGEIVVLENEESRFGITLTEIVSPGTRQTRAKNIAA